MRKQGWDVELPKFIASRQHVAFQWGAQDCCLFAADCVQAITGVDHMADFRGKYTTEAEAVELLEQRGGLIEAITAALGPQIPVRMAGRGDIVAVQAANGITAAVCLGDKAVFTGTRGLLSAPTLAALAAWRVK